MEYFANKNNCHGKFLLHSNDGNIMNKVLFLKFFTKIGLCSDTIGIQEYNGTFIIHINNLQLRQEFLRIIKLNKDTVSVALFSHYYDINVSNNVKQSNKIIIMIPIPITINIYSIMNIFILGIIFCFVVILIPIIICICKM